MDNRQLCIDIAHCETEREVVKILSKAGYWENSSAWKYYGGVENNFSTIGNQQSKPESALVEKIINSVDAVLMAECLSRGVKPDSVEAPGSIADALESFFDVTCGKLSSISAAKRKKLADYIFLVASGMKTKPCYAIVDRGEGQTPEKMPETLLSLGKSNKLRIPFVQGKFNMGGTGVLQFCGKYNLQLVVSRRNPKVVVHEPADPSAHLWGFTVVRREDPRRGVRSSCYRYLAPAGKVLTFQSDGMPLLPMEYPDVVGRPLSWGTYIKLYEYQVGALKTNIVFDLYNRLSLLMPSIALPVRLIERRRGYSGHSYSAVLAGLSVRLEEDKKENLEEGFNPPATSELSVLGQNMKVSIYAFKRGQSEKYRKNEGVIFTINGQTHGYLRKAFFTRKAIGMGYLADSLLVLVDCSDFDGRAREDLFMNSRDRLRSGELKSKIEAALSSLLRNHPGLKSLRERRRREDITNKLDDAKPLTDTIETILKKSPTLSKLFVDGVRLPNPLRMAGAKAEEIYSGLRFPTYFKLVKPFGKDNPKPAPVKTTVRLRYRTDVENDYFDRDADPGRFILRLDDNDIESFSVNLWNGQAVLNIMLPNTVKPGQLLHFTSEVDDVTRTEPIVEEFFLLVKDKANNKPGKPGGRTPPVSNDEGDDGKRPSRLDLPNVVEVYQPEWMHHGFNRESALRVVDAGDGGYDFYINMDNVHLLTEKKSELNIEPSLLDARYKYGMVLLAIALLKADDSSDLESEGQDESADEDDIYTRISLIAKAVSPVLLPMISNLGALQEEAVEDIH